MKHDWGPAPCRKCVNSHGSHYFLRASRARIAFTGTLMEKQASGHPTVLKRQDLRGLLKSDLRGETQTLRQLTQICRPQPKPLWSAAALGCGDKSFVSREEFDK